MSSRHPASTWSPSRPARGLARGRAEVHGGRAAAQRQGIGSAVMAEGIRRLKAAGAVLLWANARDSALPFYRSFGFSTVEGSGYTPPHTGRPHHIIELDLTS
ncbi:MAG TPA: GNAT family N-acetyltransferase [Candidatus Dormibacteraeota bacterium]|nr:GNAT family N-acetyltransferase [Candidatus Dormibacteraeota bacterium]